MKLLNVNVSIVFSTKWTLLHLLHLKEDEKGDLAAWIIPLILQKRTLALLWNTTKESSGNISYDANLVAGVTMVTSTS